MVAFAIVFRPLVVIVFEGLHRLDHLVGIRGACSLGAHEHRLDPGIAERTVVGRNLAAVHSAEFIVELLGGRDLVLDAPVIGRSPDDPTERLCAGGEPAGVEQNRRYDLHTVLHAEISSLLERNLLIAAEVANAENVGLERLNARQQGREVGGTERMADISEGFDAERLACALKAANHLVAVSVVRRQECDLLAEFGEHIAPDCACGQMRRQSLVKCVFAEVLGLVDLVGLADRVIDDLAFLGDVVDRELNRSRQAADDEVDLVLVRPAPTYASPLRRD